MPAKTFILLIVTLLLSFAAISQQREKVLFSGVIVENDSLKPVSFANIVIVNKNLGTMSTIDGYFSFYAHELDTVQFSALGFSTSVFRIPDSINVERYSIIQLMKRDTLELAETIIYPWPASERDFKDSFINDKINNDQEEIAKKNIQIDAITQPKQVVFHEASAAYNYDNDMKTIASELYYNGQSPPLSVLDPIAWYKFVKAWRRGDFKKKK